MCGQRLPESLHQSDRLPETLFTPTTKATSGHDTNISWKECRALLGEDTARQMRDWTIELYEYGRAYAATKGIIIADTKFEFGLMDTSSLASPALAGKWVEAKGLLMRAPGNDRLNLTWLGKINDACKPLR